MLYLILSLIVLGVFSALLGWLSHNKEGHSDVIMPDNDSCATCDGTREGCEQECLLEAYTKEIEYFDDEELDRFRGRLSDSYTDAEAEEFREVMYTMHPHEVKAWNRSLILREIQLPDQLKDELIMLVQDT